MEHEQQCNEFRQSVSIPNCPKKDHVVLVCICLALVERDGLTRADERRKAAARIKVACLRARHYVNPPDDAPLVCQTCSDAMAEVVVNETSLEYERLKEGLL